MRYSEEQKEILTIIKNYSWRNHKQPKALFFDTIIRLLLPENYFLCFDSHNENRIYLKSTEKDVQDLKNADGILGKIITYLFLIDNLIDNNQVVFYLKDETTDLTEGYIKDCKGNKMPSDKEIFEFKGWSSPTFKKLFDKYKDAVILPNYSLINYISNDFKSPEEISQIQNLEKATESLNAANRSIKYSRWALVIAIITTIISVFVDFKSLGYEKQGLVLSKQGLQNDSIEISYASISATDSVLKMVHSETDSVLMMIHSETDTVVLKNLKNELIHLNTKLVNDLKRIIKQEREITRKVEVINMTDSVSKE